MDTYCKKKILIVDDSNEVREVLRDYLSSIRDFELYSAESGKEALLKIQQVQNSNRPYFDLIFLDWNMPGLNGLETLIEMRKTMDLEKSSVIIFSADLASEEIKQIKDAKINFIMSKPFDFEIIRNLITKLCS